MGLLVVVACFFIALLLVARIVPLVVLLPAKATRQLSMSARAVHRSPRHISCAQNRPAVRLHDTLGQVCPGSRGHAVLVCRYQSAAPRSGHSAGLVARRCRQQAVDAAKGLSIEQQALWAPYAADVIFE